MTPVETLRAAAARLRELAAAVADEWDTDLWETMAEYLEQVVFHLHPEVELIRAMGPATARPLAKCLDAMADMVVGSPTRPTTVSCPAMELATAILGGEPCVS